MPDGFLTNADIGSNNFNINGAALPSNTTLSPINNTSNYLTPTIIGNSALNVNTNNLDNSTTPINNPNSNSQTQNPTTVGNTSNSNGSGFLDNQLNSYQNYAYHIKLYTAGDTGSASPIIIAETGVTGFNIKSLELTTKMTGGPTTRGIAATAFKFTIIEPMGTSFLDAFYQAAQTTNMANWQKGQYFLEISFKGYNEDGSLNTNITNYVWDYAINITKISTKLTSAGSEYDIDAQEDGTISISERHIFNIADTMNVKGNNLGAFVQDFNTKYNASLQKRFGNIYNFSVKMWPYNGNDPANWTFIDNPQTAPFVTRGMDNANKDVYTANVPRGTNINDFMKNLIGSTTQGVQLALDVNGIVTSVAALGSNYRETGLFMTYPQVTYTGDYDTNQQLYNKNIVMHMAVQKTQDTILHPNEVNFPQQAINAMISDNRLQKRYQYLYTGQNTEVIDLGINFNLAYQAPLPNQNGDNYYNAQITPHATAVTPDTLPTYTGGPNQLTGSISPNNIPSTISTVSSNNPLGALQSITNSIAQGLGTLGVLTGSNSLSAVSQLIGQASRTAAIIGNVGSSLSAPSQVSSLSNFINTSNVINGVAIPTLISATTTINGAINSINNGSFGVPGANTFSSGTTLGSATTIPSAAQTTSTGTAGTTTLGSATYIEDNLNGANSILQVSTAQTGDSSRNSAGTGAQGQQNRNKSIYGSLLDQKDASLGLNQIDNLKIKGDPYWLGNNPVNVLLGQQVNQNAYNLINGGCYILLTLKYPYNWAETGNYSFRTNDVYNGVYNVTQIDNHFVNGQFTQTLHAIRTATISAAVANSTSAAADAALGAAGNTNGTTNPGVS